MKIIKFLTVNRYFWENLKSSCLYFNSIDNFNDPYEGIFRFRLGKNRETIREFYLNRYSGNPDKLSYYLEHPEELERKINKTFDFRATNNGVTCFSKMENFNNILMWAHYASNHKGVCLVFESDELQFFPGPALRAELENQKSVMTSIQGPLHVEYTEKYLDIDPTTRELNQTSFLTTKYKAWQEERELRYISPCHGLFQYPATALKQIIFGFRCQDNDCVGIRNIIRELGIQVDFETIRLKENEFGLELTPKEITAN